MCEKSADVLWGHYFGEDYETARLDFATQSGLLERNLFFFAKQLTEIYRAASETLESGYHHSGAGTAPKGY